MLTFIAGQLLATTAHPRWLRPYREGISKVLETFLLHLMADFLCMGSNGTYRSISGGSGLDRRNVSI